jgi:predicted nucleic acid-binding protein
MIVLDTNIVLDLLVFDDERAHETGFATWLTAVDCHSGDA